MKANSEKRVASADLTQWNPMKSTKGGHSGQPDEIDKVSIYDVKVLGVDRSEQCMREYNKNKLV